jgi:methionyl-tRNA synthetase
MADKLLYVTTTLPYVNSDPHIGFAMEIIRADTIVRYKKLFGNKVFFNTGTDEHGAKIYENALKANQDPQQYVDGFAKKFQELIPLLGISSDINFIRTTDEKHIKAAQEMWKRCEHSGDIYKKLYKVKYCVGCELEKTDSELVDAKCPIHPNRDIEIREEENYFFKFSNYQQKLLDFYAAHLDFVVPDFRFNEIKAFVERGLEDFSISRLKSKMPWGVQVPGDDDHVMYVWFDALTSYISTLDWPDEKGDFEFWKEGMPVQYCGKDNLRQQSAMWQAMLMSAGLPNSTHIVIDGFITSGGQKMSKSVGNVISPFDVIEEFKSVTDYPEDVLRFVLLHDISSFEDGDITLESIKSTYGAHLANGIGNLTNRIMKMSTSHLKGGDHPSTEIFPDEFVQAMDSFDVKKAIEFVSKEIGSLDNYIQTTEPFKVIKVDEVKGIELITEMRSRLYTIARLLQPFLSKTSDKIKECIHENKMPEKPLFARLA